jgi:hypothetical protein
MIVKVQLSLESNAPGHTPGARMLVYNKSRTVMFEKDADEEMVKKMKGMPKGFFHANNITEGEKKGRIEITEEAPWQDW